jgi:hypothetical protein
MDNAMFMPGGNLYGIIERPYHSLMFFQGNHRDFAYDADVIYHEFTHAVVDTVVGGVGLMLSRRDEQGLHTMSRAMNEAYADFFATSFHDNPLQGEYAMSGPDMPGPRDLAARPRSTCPARMINEEHYDSAPYSEALWEIREALDPEAFERAAFAALCTLPPNASFHEGAAATVAAVEVELSANEWSSSTSARPSSRSTSTGPSSKRSPWPPTHPRWSSSGSTSPPEHASSGSAMSWPAAWTPNPS